MPHNIIQVSPFVRANDLFVLIPGIDASAPPESISHPLISGGPNDTNTRFQADFYKHIACDIVVETVFDYPYPYISEKTLRSFACKRMLILLGPVGSLRLLKEKGFKTFDDIIDEEYDNMQDPIQRFNAVVSEIKKFCNTPLDTIKDYIKENSDKFENNFLNLKNLQELELQKIAHKFDINYDSH
jgi:hypothetical protein